MMANGDDFNNRVKVFSPLEHIRLRSGMYVGWIGDDDGVNYDDVIYRLMKEVIDNSVDEFLMGYGKRIEVSLDWNSGRCSIRDYGRGIPPDKVVDCVSNVCVGGMFYSADTTPLTADTTPLTVGMNGVGVKAVNALSEVFYVRSVRDGEFSEATFERGRLKSTNRGKIENTSERNGTYVSFMPDSTIFMNCKFREEHVIRRLELYAFLNIGLEIMLNGELIFCAEDGLRCLIEDASRYENIYKPFHYRSKKLEFAFVHGNSLAEEYYSFVNGHPTTEGGTHLEAFKEGLIKALNYFSGRTYDIDDIGKGIVGAVSVRLPIPIFDGSVKTKLAMREEIYAELVDTIEREAIALFRNFPSETAKLIRKVDEVPKYKFRPDGTWHLLSNWKHNGDKTLTRYTNRIVGNVNLPNQIIPLSGFTADSLQGMRQACLTGEMIASSPQLKGSKWLIGWASDIEFQYRAHWFRWLGAPNRDKGEFDIYLLKDDSLYAKHDKDQTKKGDEQEYYCFNVVGIDDFKEKLEELIRTYPGNP